MSYPLYLIPFFFRIIESEVKRGIVITNKKVRNCRVDVSLTEVKRSNVFVGNVVRCDSTYNW